MKTRTRRHRRYAWLCLAATLGVLLAARLPAQQPSTAREGVSHLGSTFTDDPLVPGVTPIKVAHITELRARIDTLRMTHGLASFPFTDATLIAGVTSVKVIHLLELRTALADAYAAASQTLPVYANPIISAGLTAIRTTHIAQVRAAVVLLESMGSPDTQAPTIAITSPTPNPTYTTASGVLTLAGMASDDVGVTEVTWANDHGDGGMATGTTSWSQSGFALQSGTNVLTATARDAAGNTAADTLTVTYTGSWYHQRIDTAPLHARSAETTAWLDAAGGWGLGRMQIDFSLVVLSASPSDPRRTFTPTGDFFSPDCDAVPVPSADLRTAAHMLPTWRPAQPGPLQDRDLLPLRRAPALLECPVSGAGYPPEIPDQPLFVAGRLGCVSSLHAGARVDTQGLSAWRSPRPGP